MPLSIQVAALSDCGNHRLVNEDSWISDTNLGLYAIADGMGGHGSGDVASSMAVDAIREVFAQTSQAATPMGVTKLIQSAIKQANSAVYGANQSPHCKPGSGMGTTLVGLHLPSPEMQTGTVFNVGDSRLYRYRDSQLTQLTEDHTLLREWQRGNQRGPAPPGNIIMRGVGLFETVESDITPISLQRGDLILLCSDGLSDMLNDTKLAGMLENAKSATMESLCAELVREANDNGGIDNITAIMIRVA